MKSICVSILAAGFFAWGTLPALAQPVPPQPEVPPPQHEIPPQEPPPTEGLPLLHGPGCPQAHPAIKPLVVEQARPVQIIVPREVITTVTRPGLIIEYQDVKRVVIEYELKPQEVLREVPCTIMQPCQEVDPHTGKVCTVMKPITHMKIEKQTVFVNVPVQREIIEKVPCLKEVEEVIPQRAVLLEWRTHLEPTIGVVPVPTVVYPDQYLTTPRHCPSCATGHCPHHP